MNTFSGKNGTVQIAVLQRGWVYVGVFKQEGTLCELTHAACVRVWGTTDGLGEIADSGPTNATKLDKCKSISFHELAIINLMDCNAEKWKKVLGV